MPDHGHPLRFGTFPEPLAQPPHTAVDLAVASEGWGYDLVMFQDHPYQPGYLDVWTLMTWVAARTQHIQIGPNVLNMAMRPPAVVGTAAASLDQLSAGRFTLGVGAGLFWDAMTAMGVARRTHAQAIDALSEAIDVIRATWPTPDTDGHRIRLPGRYHHLDGMRSGPAPAHPIPLWVGAYKPRMLRLVGQKADGWTAALGPIQPRPQWQQASAVIDDAAAAAERDPATIRRIAGISGTFGTSSEFLAGPSGQWVDQLLPTVIEDGIDTFILATDDRTTLQHFAAEVIPALRAAVTAERTQPSAA